MVAAVQGGVTTPFGFRAAGVAAGIKANGTADLALLVSDKPAAAAAVFTTNLAQAAPVIVSREHVHESGGNVRAIVVNSGCANACTGEDGLHVARDMMLQYRPDLITLDIEMPRMDGLSFLRRLMEHHPIAAIVVSSLTQAGSAASVEALREGMQSTLERYWEDASAVLRLVGRGQLRSIGPACPGS